MKLYEYIRLEQKRETEIPAVADETLETIVTERRSAAKNVGCFRRHLFVCGLWGVFVNMITSE